jgi:hypothetical protein
VKIISARELKKEQSDKDPDAKAQFDKLDAEQKQLQADIDASKDSIQKSRRSSYWDSKSFSIKS